MPDRQRKYLKLTEAVYKSIEFLPDEEPLANKIKERALGVLANLILNHLITQSNPISFFTEKENEGLEKKQILTQTLTDIEILKNYLKIGRDQKWIDNFNFLILAKEYDTIKEKIKEELEEKETEVNTTKIKKQRKREDKDKKQKSPENSLSSRERKILKILKKKEKVQVSDLKEVLGGVSKRTLRRDLDDLLKKEKIIRKGEWNQVFYKIKQ